jgi:arylsulfatase A-like enzyme
MASVMSALARRGSVGVLAASLVLAACSDAPAPQRDGSNAGTPSGAPATESPKAPTAAAAPRARARGVVLFVVDTLRADRLSTWGHDRPTSPVLTALAARGTRWSNNYTQGSWTVPSMLSMMTGLYLKEESESMPARQPALAELLSEAGVETAAFVANRVVGLARDFDRGFDHFDVTRFAAEHEGTKSYDAHFWVQAFERWLTSRKDPERPWFAWVHVLDPHMPYEPRKAFDVYQNQRTEQEKSLLVPRWVAERARVESMNAGRQPFDPYASIAALVAQRAAYDGEVRQVDAALEKIVSTIEEHGGFDEVLLVFASDHGEMLYEYLVYPAAIERRREWKDGLPNGFGDVFAVEHTGYLYEEVWHTPLVMVGPGIEAGRTVDGLSANIDIAPTVLEALGVEYDGPLDGTSKYRSDFVRDLVFGHGANTTAVRTVDGRILIEHPHNRYGVAETEPAPVQLLQSGPSGMAVDRAAERPSDVAELRAKLEQWRASVRFETNGAVDRAAADEALRALGYIGGDER